jgi:hypothetical protein
MAMLVMVTVPGPGASGPESGRGILAKLINTVHAAHRFLFAAGPGTWVGTQQQGFDFCYDRNYTTGWSMMPETIQLHLCWILPIRSGWSVHQNRQQGRYLLTGKERAVAVNNNAAGGGDVPRGAV